MQNSREEGATQKNHTRSLHIISLSLLLNSKLGWAKNDQRVGSWTISRSHTGLEYVRALSDLLRCRGLINGSDTQWRHQKGKISPKVYVRPVQIKLQQWKAQADLQVTYLPARTKFNIPKGRQQNSELNSITLTISSLQQKITRQSKKQDNISHKQEKIKH